MRSFADHVTDYLRLRRSFGFKLHEHERLLRKFAIYMDDLGAETVTIELSLAWALERDLPAGSVVAATRLLVVRGFAHYMIGLDPRTEIPPTQLIPGWLTRSRESRAGGRRPCHGSPSQPRSMRCWRRVTDRRSSEHAITQC